MNPDKLARIKEIMDVANKDYATNAEVAMILKQITNYLTKTKGEYDDLMEDMQERVDDQMDKVKEMVISSNRLNKNERGELKNMIRDTRKELMRYIESMAEMLRNDLEDIELMPGPQGIPGDQGIPGEPGTNGSPDTGQQIVLKINMSASKISKNKIEGLQDLENLIRQAALAASMPITTTFINGKRAKNIEITGATVQVRGDTAYVTGIIGTGGTGGGDNNVNEVVSGSGTSWTLANTPTDSTKVKLYVNGQRLTPTVDYSITGTAITTVLSWASGTLIADYSS